MLTWSCWSSKDERYHQRNLSLVLDDLDGKIQHWFWLYVLWVFEPVPSCTSPKSVSTRKKALEHSNAMYLCPLQKIIPHLSSPIVEACNQYLSITVSKVIQTSHIGRMPMQCEISVTIINTTDLKFHVNYTREIIAGSDSDSLFSPISWSNHTLHRSCPTCLYPSASATAWTCKETALLLTTCRTSCLRSDWLVLLLTT